MKCLHPVTCWQCGQTLSADCVFSPRLVFSRRAALDYFVGIYGSDFKIPMDACEMSVPCNKCINCQVQKRKDMSVRLAHEASQFENCCFITLTYSPENVPVTDGKPFDKSQEFFYSRHHLDVPFAEFEEQSKVGFAKHKKRLEIPCYQTLLPSDVQKFMKRLRRHLEYVPVKRRGIRDHIKKVRYFAVGEYGGKTYRPHYHIVVFGWKPSDLEHLKWHNGKEVFTSRQLQKCWRFGFSSVTEVNPYVAKYCARYVTKKFSRLGSADPRSKCVIPEFVLQSTRDGAIGATWFDKYGCDACKVGLATLRVGDMIQRVAIPRYYWNRLRKKFQDVWIKCREDKISFLLSNDTKPDMDEIKRYAEFHREKIRREVDNEVF